MLISVCEMCRQRENVLVFLSTTVKVIVNLQWQFLIEVLFGSEKGVGIRIELPSLSLF